MGYSAGSNLTTGSHNIDIANAGLAGDNKTIRIGTEGTQTQTLLASVDGVTIPGPAQPAVINANGQPGTATSSSLTSSSAPRPAAGREIQTGGATNDHQLLAQLKPQAAQLHSQAQQLRQLNRLKRQVNRLQSQQ